MNEIENITSEDIKTINEALNSEFMNDEYTVSIKYNKGLKLSLDHDDSLGNDIPFAIFYRAIELLKQYGYNL